MASALSLQISKQIKNKFIFSKYLANNIQSRFKSTVNERVAITDDGSTIVCWHPEKHFPYECSKPLPEELNMESNSVLKVQNLSEVYDVFKPKSEDETREELMKITSTSKHIWFPRGKKTYKKKPVPRDREYL